MVKQGGKKTVKRARAKISVVFSPPPDLQKGNELSFINKEGERIICPWEIRPVTFQLTKDEKEKARRIYRKEYMKKPETVAKLAERMRNPEVIQKKKDYAERKEVKERKKQLATRARAIRRVLKETDPEKYAELQRRVEEALLENARFNSIDAEEFIKTCDDPACDLHGSNGEHYIIK